MQPYEEQLSSIDLNLAARPIPELNGALLHLPAGTVFLVVDGRAKGFTSWTHFMRVCSEFPSGGGPPPEISKGELDKIMGKDRGGWGMPPNAPIFYSDIKNYFTNVPNVNWIEQGPQWTASARTVYYLNGPLAIQDYENGEPVLWGVPSQRVRYTYKLRHGAAAELISKEEYEFIKNRGGERILTV